MVVGSDAKSSILLMVMLREVAKILLIVGNGGKLTAFFEYHIINQFLEIGRFCIGKVLENSRMKNIAVTK